MSASPDDPESDLTPTADEKRWWARLRRVIGDMPKSAEILVSQHQIELARAGATDRYFEKHGHVDNIETIFVTSIRSHQVKDVQSKL